MMYRFMFVSMASLISVGASAQTVSTTVAPTTFGVTGGINWNNINGKSASGADLNNGLKTGFNGGVNMEIPISKGFYLQPGVEYRRKGAELANGKRVSLSYIDVPVNFLYKPAVGRGAMLLGFGPYAGIGIGGNVKAADGTETDVKFSNTYSATEAEDLQYKKLDAGANFVAGYEFRNRFSVALKAQLGLININRDTRIANDGTELRNTGFGLSLGQRF